MWEIQYGNTSNMYKKDVFEMVVKDTKNRYNLDKSFTFDYDAALARIRRGSLSGDGKATPLIAIEREVVNLLLCMSKLKRALTVSESLKLINELIDGTEMQQKLIKWKKAKKMYHTSEEDEGKVGLSY